MPFWEGWQKCHQYCHSSPLSFLPCGIYFFLINQFFVDSVRISGILPKIRHISVSLCYKGLSSQLESNYWRLWKLNTNKSYSSNKNNFQFFLLFLTLLRLTHDWGLTILDSLTLTILHRFIFFKVPWQFDRQISAEKGILKLLLSELAAVHSFPQKTFHLLLKLLTCTQIYLESW